jgi:hypothetical protein
MMPGPPPESDDPRDHLRPGPPPDPQDPYDTRRPPPGYGPDDADNPFRLKSPPRVSSSDLSGGDWLLCILCPGIGCIVGIVRLAQGHPNGGKMLGFSLLFGLLWNVLRFVLMAASQQHY